MQVDGEEGQRGRREQRGHRRLGSQVTVRDAGEERPGWRHVAAVAVTGGMYVGAFNQAVRSLIGQDPWNWAAMLLAAGVAAATMAATVGLLRARWLPSWGDREGRVMLRDALRTGELPSGARPEAWRRLVYGQLLEARRARWLIASSMAGTAVLVAVAAAVVNDDAWTVWTLAGALAAFVVVPLRSLRQHAERAEALLARLDALTPPPAGSAFSPR